MSDTSLRTVFINPDQAKAAIAGQIGPFCRALWERGIPRVAVTVEPEEDARSLQRNREYWGYVLRPISEQAQINGIGATAEGWHEYYRKMFLGYDFIKVREPGKKRTTVRRVLKSTTDLSERSMRKYLEQVRAHAATTFSVTFPAMEMDQ